MLSQQRICSKLVSMIATIVAIVLLLDAIPTSMAWMSSQRTQTVANNRYVPTQSQPFKININNDNNNWRLASRTDDMEEIITTSNNSKDQPKQRRQVLHTLGILMGATVSSTIVMPTNPSNALVKGVAPPPKKSASDKPKCTNVEECQAMAEKRDQELRAKEEQGPPPKVTSSGIKYRDLEEGTTDGDSVKDGDSVDVYYKVLKLGKRSYDGISGEGTVVFSRGYGLEDDEDKPGVKSFQTVVGAYSNIVAFNEAIVGMKVGGIRRFSIVPQKGWEKPTRACDGGPGGGGSGGELKTDYVVVPTATMVDQEACFDTSKQPFPSSYAQQRRMAQRFDQSLIMELQVVKISSSNSNGEIL